MSNRLADDDPRLQSLCKVGREGCCRWIARDGSGYFCAKLDPELAKHITERFELGKMGAKGDNCPGLS